MSTVSLNRVKTCETAGAVDRDVRLHVSILNALGFVLDRNAVILDFGCGAGQMVRNYRDAGFLETYGADLVLDDPQPFLRQLDPESYRLPFDDNSVDYVFSNSVLEHVDDFHGALREIHRVLKPGGVSLHIFPATVKPIEPHVFVPLGGVVRARAWLDLWALLGIRNSFQRTLSARETARRNYDYLHTKVFYRSTSQIREAVMAVFGNVAFAQAALIAHSYGRARLLAPIVQRVPFVATLYGTFHIRCLVFSKNSRH